MHHVKTEDLIVIDIETASVSPTFNELNSTWQKLWTDKTAKVLPEGITAEEFYPTRAGVMAEFSKIICISMGYFIKEQNLKIRVKSYYGDDEKKILKSFL